MPSSLPDYDSLPRRSGLRSAWDVWLPGGDVFGCLNLLTEERAAEAARLVQRGAVFPLNWSMGMPDPPLFNRSRYRHEVTGSETSTGHDDVLHGWNTQSSSQWDGFRHIRNPLARLEQPGTGHFGGVDDGDHGIHHWAQRGIVGRGVLADVARWRDAQGRPIRYGEPDAVSAAELTACLADQGTEVAEGDVLLVRFGWVGWYEAQPHDVRDRLRERSTLVAVGFEAGEDLARTLWNLHVAAVGTDTAGFEAWPLGQGLSREEVEAYRSEQVRLHEIFAHTVLLPMLGLPLGELFALEALADDCAADGHYGFMITSAPLNLPNGVASPPCALAIK